MSAGGLTASELKACCADFYADDVVRQILGDSFHPGGDALTRTLLDGARVGPADRLLDLAAGQGTSAILAARERGCQVVALDLSEANLERARRGAEGAGVGELVTVLRTDAEHVDLPNGSFDVILCECAFCTFVDKPRAAREMARLLRPGGRLALSDMALEVARFPEDLHTLLLRVACIADALTEESMEAIFTEAGFAELRLQDASWALAEMVRDIRRRILAVELMERLGKLSLGGIDLIEGKRVAGRTLELIRHGDIRYVTLTGARS